MLGYGAIAFIVLAVSILTLDLSAVGSLTEDAFYKLVKANPDMKFERTAFGELIIVSPTGGETGNQNFELYIDLGIWNRQQNLGKAFDSSTCFKLPNGANRSPDVAWVTLEKWESLTPPQRQKFPPLAPDFVVELRSTTDDLETLQAKMQEYINNGVRLGWLIDPQNQQVEIYRQGQAVEVRKSPTTLLGEDVLPGFVLDLRRILF
ncbi:MAG: Uma2 family endonuclease [Scytonema sp. PMC 1069.18]|nr:Uma2 family endonuclease [Scytonema sp. PMC 1069.18]MEC4882901.1 Uma2 family endonuclease [Scytonema sp. PMC 1070.18]